MVEAESEKPVPPHPTASSKLTPPRIRSVFPRARLFKWLTEARRNYPIIWVSAPAGAGKTTLTASYLIAESIEPLWYVVDETDADLASFFYHLKLAAPATALPQHHLSLLTPEYFAGLPAFTRNFFRSLFSRMGSQGVLVLENFQDIPDGTGIDDLLAIGFAEIPEGINVIVLSRSHPPPALMRLLANNQIALLDWNSLQLAEDEALGIARLKVQADIDIESLLPRIMAETHGWAAGLVLILEQLKAELPLLNATTSSDFSRIFDYFAAELFRRAEAGLQNFLLQTAFFPQISVADAEALTGNAQARRFLDKLRRRNYFTVRHGDGSYEYHPLFRSFLINYAAEIFSPAQIRHIQQSCAHILQSTGKAEMAASLLINVADWDALAMLTIAHAPAMAAQGRMHTLTSWLQTFPLEYRNSKPWLLYWLGVSRMPFDQAEARAHFEQSFTLFERENNAEPLYVTWTGIVNSILMEQSNFVPIAKWLDIYPSLQSNREPPSEQARASSLISFVAALIFHQPASAHLAPAMREVDLLIESAPEAWALQCSVLIVQYLFLGDLRRANQLLDSLRPYAEAPNAEPALRVLWCTAVATHAIFAASLQTGLSYANEGLELAEKHGVASAEMLAGAKIMAELLSRNIAIARRSADRFLPLMQRTSVQCGFLLFCTASVALHEKDIPRARREVEQSLQLILSVSSPICVAFVQCARAVIIAKAGDTEAGLAQIDEARHACEKIPSSLLRYCFALAEANVRYWRGEHTQALKAFMVWIQAAQDDSRIFFPPWQLLDEASALCDMTLHAGLLVEYVRKLIKSLQLSPPTPVASDQWPFPVKIYLLGRFSLLINDEPQNFSTKSAARPLNMLRCLIALGGRQVSQQKLIETLWPDSEGDAANSTFHATLHRLRKLLKVENAVLLKDGAVSLDAHHVWVDVWSLARTLTLLKEACDKKNHENKLDQLYDKASQLYKGPFVVAENGDGQSRNYCEKLQRHMVKSLFRLSEAFRENPNKAISIYEKIVEIDSLHEPAYQQMMRLYSQQGKTAEAAATYMRCRKALSSGLGVMPSEVTFNLYRDLNGI